MPLLHALRHPQFALLWGGQTISLLGDSVFSIALAWIVVLQTGSSTAMGTVVMAQLIPTILFVLLGGTVADRVSKRLVMLWSDFGRGIIVLIVTICELLHLLYFWQLLAMALFFGVVDGFFSPSYRAIVPQVVETDVLASANSLTTLSRQVSQAIGPALGAFCIAAVGVGLAFGLDGASFFISALFLCALRLPSVLAKSGHVQEHEKPAEPAIRVSRWQHFKGILGSIKEGLLYIKGVRWIWVTILLASLANIGYAGPMAIVLPKLVLDVYHAGPWLLGLIGTTGAIGAIAGTLAIGQIKHLRHRGVVAYLAMMASSLALIGFGLPLPTMIQPFVACLASALAGFSLSAFQIIWVTLLQERVPTEKLGRVSSVDMLGSYSLLPISFVVLGALADYFGPIWVFLGGGTLILLIASIGLCLPDIRKL